MGKRAERRDRGMAVLRDHPEWSDRRIAREVGVDHKTIGAWRRQLGEVPIPDPVVPLPSSSELIHARWHPPAGVVPGWGQRRNERRINVPWTAR